MSNDATSLWSVIPPPETRHFRNVPCYLAVGSLGIAVRFSGLRARKLSGPNSEGLWWKGVARYCSLLSYIVWYVDLGEKYRLHLQDNWNSPTRLYDTIIHNTTLRIFTAVKTLWPPHATEVHDLDINCFYVPGGSGRTSAIFRNYFERKVYPIRDDHGVTYVQSWTEAAVLFKLCKARYSAVRCASRFGSSYE